MISRLWQTESFKPVKGSIHTRFTMTTHFRRVTVGALCAVTPLRDFCRSHKFISSIYLFAVFGRPFNTFSFHLGLRVGENILPKLEHCGSRLQMFFFDFLFTAFQFHSLFIQTCLFLLTLYIANNSTLPIRQAHTIHSLHVQYLYM